MGFDRCNYFLKIRKSTGTPTPNMGVHLGVHLGVWMFILTFSHTTGFLSWLALLQTLALVVSPRLGLRHLQLKDLQLKDVLIQATSKMMWRKWGKIIERLGRLVKL
jgi:hypothetical protein